MCVFVAVFLTLKENQCSLTGHDKETRSWRALLRRICLKHRRRSKNELNKTGWNLCIKHYLIHSISTTYDVIHTSRKTHCVSLPRTTGSHRSTEYIISCLLWDPQETKGWRQQTQVSVLLWC